MIAPAAVINKCLMGSGAADRIVRSFLKALGEKVFEYQKKHYDLTIRMSKLSPSVRKVIEGELDRL